MSAWISVSRMAVGLMVAARPESKPNAAEAHSAFLRTATKRKAVAAMRQTAMVRSRWPPSARPSRPWTRMKSDAEKRAASHPMFDPTRDEEAVTNGAPGLWQRMKNAAEAAASRVKSKRRQARSFIPKTCIAASSMRKLPGMFMSPSWR